MKFAPAIILFVAVFGMALAVETCPSSEACKDHTGAFLVTRLWTLRPNATFNSTDVINEFEMNFAPTASNLPGFIEYVGANNITTNNAPVSVNSSSNITSPGTSNSSLIFFYNVFNDSVTGAVVQEEAKAFYLSGVLFNQIEPVRFENGTFHFFFSALNKNATLSLNTSSQFCEDNITDLTLSTRLWELTSNATLNGSQVIEIFKTGFAPTIAEEPGFREYAGILLQDGLMFFYNVFDTPEGGAKANLKAADFVATGELHGQIQKVDFQTATIQFDIECKRNSTMV